MPSVDSFETLLKKRGALREGHFVLASGNHSEHYVQTAELMQEPHLVDSILDDYHEKLNQKFDTINKILTAATGGITFAQQVGLKLKKTTIFAERTDSNELHLKRGFSIKDGEKILLVEDVVTTGGTLEELESLVREHGGEVAGVFSMINRSDMEDWNGREFFSLLSVNYPVYSPENCPRCSEGSDAVRPGTKEVEEEPDYEEVS